MDIRDDSRAFTDRRRHTLYRSRTHIADSEDSRNASGEATERQPAGHFGHDEALVVKSQCAVEPAGVRLRANHHEQRIGKRAAAWLEKIGSGIGNAALSVGTEVGKIEATTAITGFLGLS